MFLRPSLPALSHQAFLQHVSNPVGYDAEELGRLTTERTMQPSLWKPMHMCSHSIRR